MSVPPFVRWTTTTSRVCFAFVMVAVIVIVWSPPAFSFEAELTPAGTAQTSDSRTTSEKSALRAEDRPGTEAEKSVEEKAPLFDEIPWELRPYRVLVSLAIDSHSALTPGWGEQLEDSLRVRIAGLMGQYWQTEIETNRWLLPAAGASLERLETEELSERYLSSDFDKALILTIEHRQGIQLSGCEWDRSSQERGPVLHRDVLDRRRTGAVALELIMDLFRPLAQIDASEEETVELRARAGELLAPESLSVMFQPGDMLLPYFRYFDRDKKVRSIQLVPWTYLRIEDIARSRMKGLVETAFHAPLSGSRRRVELVAIRVRPVYPTTRLRLARRNNPGRPLVGVRVRVNEHLPTEEHPDPEMTEMMTDRFGRVEVIRSTGVPLRRLLVHSGGAVLANVPFVPGLVRELSMELPDDSARLQAEGNLAIVQGELIDLVSRRTIMLARALSLARKEQWKETDELMSEIDRQPSIASFRSKILAIRVPAVTESRRNRDLSAEKRIVSMCRELEDLVERYLNRDPVREVAAEINELRKLSK